MDIDDERGDPALSAALRTGATRHAAPPELRRRLLRELGRAAAARGDTDARHGWRQWLGIGAAFAAGIVVSALTGLRQPAADPDASIDNEAIAAHVRSLQPGHLSDVASSDQHTVKPWLSSRLDFSPPVHDLAVDGFPLTGGRLDYIGGRPVAALLYRRNQHVINVFVWPAREREAGTAVASAALRGFNSIAWTQAGMRWRAVSDLAAPELGAFAGQLQRAAESP